MLDNQIWRVFRSGLMRNRQVTYEHKLQLATIVEIVVMPTVTMNKEPSVHHSNAQIP